MSIVYSHISDRYIDTDAREAVELSNGDVVAINDDPHLIISYKHGLISKDEMILLGFQKEEL